MWMCARVFSCFSPILCDPMDCSLPGSSVHGTSQARILEWFAMPPPGDLPNPGVESASPAIPVLQADSLSLSHQESPWSWDSVTKQDN